MTLAEIEALCNRATPGPWAQDITFTDVHQATEDFEHLLQGVCHVSEVSMEATPIRYRRANAELIAASRTLIPKLLKIAKAAKELLGDGYKHDVTRGIMRGGEVLAQLSKALKELESE